MLTFGVLDHGVDGGEFFGALGAAEVFGLLMVMEDNLVFEVLFAVEAERPQTRQISLLPPHLL